MKEYIALNDCKKGFVYLIHARNFFIGLFDGKEGFIGIREKFGDKFLFKEYHWNNKDNDGTVKPIREIAEFGEYCHECGDDMKLFDFLEKIEKEQGEALYNEVLGE